MRRLLLIVPLAALVFVAACGDETTVVVPSNEQTGLTVTGVGEVVAEPDVALITIGVEVQRSTVAEARDAAAAAANAVLKAAKERGVPDRDLQTVSLAIYPVYDYSGQGTPRIVGYTFANMLQVKVRDLGRVSEILDASIAAGGDAVRLQSIAFDVEDRDALLERAREAAMNDARRKAEQLAQLAGVRLGTPVTISEVVSAPPSPKEFARGAAPAADAATPIEPGTTSVTVQVSVRWGLVSD
ncbi:MAG: SIMPL domain-containing protein [Chloroflexota bacterium]|nr:SIMPL domain-containing protein [Dehalococcoidia bacterium]MDW8045944.1 SIMPL domain-containing protein [Chloroflexota bacterium]